MNPENFTSEPKLTAHEERDLKIQNMKEQKLIQQMIEKLKESEEIEDVREFWVSMIKQAIYKSLDALKTIDMEFMLLVYWDSLPIDQRGPPKAPEVKKPIEMYHIPKCDHAECSH